MNGDTQQPSRDDGERLVAWAGPDPRRVDSAAVALRDRSLTARGTSLTADYALDYTLDTGPGWVTRELSVRVRGDGWWHALVLRRDPAGAWSARWTGSGRAAGGDPDPVLPELDGAVDCDLGLCPLTNTMPVLRHDLVRAARDGRALAVDLAMAWVSVPDLAVHLSRQRYSAEGVADGGDALVGFASGGFATTIGFDGDGLVRDYPGIGCRLDLPH